MNKKAKSLLSFFHESEKPKSVLRHSWLSSGRRESAAEHTWRMALMAFLLHPHLKNKPNLLKVLKMVLTHDLVEIYAGDIPAWKKDKSQKRKLEEKAIIKLTQSLPARQGIEIRALWREYRDNKTLTANYVKALDRLEVLIQHSEADLKYLVKDEFKFNLTHGVKDSEFDPFLKHIRQAVNKDFLRIYKTHKVNPKLYL